MNYVCDMIRADKMLAQGFNALGWSQVSNLISSVVLQLFSHEFQLAYIKCTVYLALERAMEQNIVCQRDVNLMVK